MNKNAIPLKEAKHQFSTLFNSIQKTDKRNFIEFVFTELMQFSDHELNKGSQKLTDGLLDDPVAILNTIAEDIKKRVPLNSILPSENITAPKTGENSDCLDDLTVHVDEFLYTEDDVDELADNGELKRNYCTDCGSRNIQPLIFISHSISREALYHIFSTRLPTLDDKTVLDIGSRLGAVLYGAYVYTDASRIIGVEMNEDFCKLQNDILQKYKMTDRVKVLHKRIEDAEDVVKTADVIVINNAFEFYVSNEEQIKIWQFLKSHIKSKTILVLNPHLETTFKNVDTGIVIDEWVKPFESEDLGAEDAEYCELGFYEVL